MPDLPEVKESLKESFGETLHQVIFLLEKHQLVENLVHKQVMEKHDQPKQDLVEWLLHKQNLRKLQKNPETLHMADIAYTLEALPLVDRLDVWDLIKAELDGNILLEV